MTDVETFARAPDTDAPDAFCARQNVFSDPQSQEFERVERSFENADDARFEQFSPAEQPSVGQLPAEESPDDTFVLSDEAREHGGTASGTLGVRFRKAGQVFFFHAAGHTVRMGSKVIVPLEQGPALGEVVSILDSAGPGNSSVQGDINGLATAQDIAHHTENSILTAEATAFCKTCIRQRSLDMKLVDVEVLHDRSKIIFFFTAPARIDFRELVKDLVRNYRTRIELRQIGVRHETQMAGGLGNCGMVCCCHKYLRTFAPVTIKMAKEQNLFLNPAKLSGMCGRLLCCLSFEQGNYEEFNRRCPKLGKKYSTNKGLIKIVRANMFSQSISGFTESNEEVEFSLEEWEALEPHRAEPPSSEQQRAQAKVPPPRDGQERRNGDAENSREHPRRSRRHEPAARSGDASLPHSRGRGGDAADAEHAPRRDTADTGHAPRRPVFDAGNAPDNISGSAPGNTSGAAIRTAHGTTNDHTDNASGENS